MQCEVSGFVTGHLLNVAWQLSLLGSTASFKKKVQGMLVGINSFPICCMNNFSHGNGCVIHRNVDKFLFGSLTVSD